MRRIIPLVVTALVALAVTATAPAVAGASDSLTPLGSFDTYNDPGLGFSPDDVTYSPVDGHLFISAAGAEPAVFETTLAGELVAKYAGLPGGFGSLGYSLTQATTGPAEEHFFMASYTDKAEVSVLEFDAGWSLVGHFLFMGACDPGPGDGIAYNPVSETLLISDMRYGDCAPGSQIFEVTMQGEPVGSFSAWPCEDVAGIAFNPPTQTYLAVCFGQNTLQEFSMDGEPLRSWDLGAYGVSQPVGIAAGEGKVFIADEIGWPISGGLIYTFESPPPVGFTFEGFYPPIDMDQPNSAKAGQTIPVKWRLTDYGGTPISDPNSFVSITSALSPGACSYAMPDAIETYASGAGVVPQYLGDGNWLFNWKTVKGLVGCYTMTLTLNDGSTHTAEFQFTK